MSEAILKEAGVVPGDVRALETVPASELIAAQLRVANATPIEAGVQLGPVVDGNVLPAHPIDAVRAGASADVAMVIGTNLDEMGLMLAVDPRYGTYGGAMTEDDLSSRLSRLTAQPEALLEVSRAERPTASPESLLVAISSDRMRVSALQLADAKTASGTAPVFVYLFTWPSPILRGRCGSFHALELPFVFDCVERAASADGGPESRELAARMSGAWISFARDGKPDDAGLPAWPAYSASERPTMLFDVDCRVEADPYRCERQIIDELGLAW
jgi:para-nitrobenzyl esterase